MKNTFLLFTVLISSISLFSCGGGDENSTPSTQSLFLGTWEMSSYEVYNCTDPSKNQNEACTPARGLCQTFIFNQDGTYQRGSSTYGTYTIISPTYISLCVIGYPCDEFVLSLSANKLSLDYQRESIAFSDGCFYKMNLQKVE